MSHDLGSSTPPHPADWNDLAVNQPGRAGRERADELHAQWRRLSWVRRLRADRDEERHWRDVADGKASVARTFDRLGDDWRVLHSLPGADDEAEIDHVLIGPSGVFAVNSSHRADQAVCLGSDTMIVDGKRIHHIQQSRREATRASQLLTEAVGFKVPVIGLVLIVGDNRFDVRQQPADGSVHVSTPRTAVRWLRRLGEEWTPYGIDRIYEYARRSTTWELAELSELPEALDALDTNESDEPGPELAVRAAS